VLYRTLNEVADEVRSGQSDLLRLEQLAMEKLATRQWAPDYISIRKRANLQAPTQEELLAGEPLVVLGSEAGQTRLIDNLEI
jgi:pantoate--beta-alanine ligase